MEPLTRHFLAWRVQYLGDREIVEALVAPEHRAPSPSLQAALKEWPGASYWTADGDSELVLVRATGPARKERWWLHISLFLVTAVCALGAGAALVWFHPPRGYGPVGWVAAGFWFFKDFLTGSPEQILSGLQFAVPFLAILLVHELGHYFAARRYAVDASPPFFLPVPPTLSPIGSLGAFLRLRSVVVDRRQLLDIGAAGPLAGFAVVLVVLAWGYATSVPVPDASGMQSAFVVFDGYPLVLGDSLLTWVFREHFMPGADAVQLSLPAFAGWAGAFITGLNLLPISQLDGGHVLYGLFGKAQAKVALLAVAGLAYLSWLTPVWLIWIFLTFLVGGGRWAHPAVLTPGRPVPANRRRVGWLCVVVFGLTFVPLPFGR